MSLLIACLLVPSHHLTQNWQLRWLLKVAQIANFNHSNSRGGVAELWSSFLTASLIGPCNCVWYFGLHARIFSTSRAICFSGRGGGGGGEVVYRIRPPTSAYCWSSACRYITVRAHKQINKQSISNDLSPRFTVPALCSTLSFCVGLTHCELPPCFSCNRSSAVDCAPSISQRARDTLMPRIKIETVKLGKAAFNPLHNDIIH